MNKEQLKIGDYLRCTVDNSIICVRKFNNKTLGILNSKNQRDSIPYSALEYYEFANPIKNNRIISNETFAIRFKNFIEDVKVNDPCSEEEKEYLLNVSYQLLKYQIQTATDESEINYLKRLNLL